VKFREIEIELGLTSHQTHYGSYQGRFYRSYDQTNSVPLDFVPVPDPTRKTSTRIMYTRPIPAGPGRVRV